MQGLTPAKRKEAYDRSKGHCHICGDFVTFDDCQIDHIWPVDLGGINDVENLLPAHPVCNHLKWHNDSTTIQRMLFLGMLANNHGFIDLTSFGETVRIQRAQRLARNWQKRRLAELSRSADGLDSQQIERTKSEASRLFDDFVAFEGEVVKEVKRRRSSRKDRAKQVVVQDSGDGTKPARVSKRHDWDHALDSMISDSRIPDRLRHAYREFARIEEGSTSDELC